ncbi:MAG: hypothetical protein WKF74_08610 [Pyrinomonadaceae bacterium]
MLKSYARARQRFNRYVRGLASDDIQATGKELNKDLNANMNGNTAPSNTAVVTNNNGNTNTAGITTTNGNTSNANSNTKNATKNGNANH